MSMRNLSDSIQLLLHLQRPLPTSLVNEIRVSNKSLIKMHDDFTNVVSEMRVWSFYETIDSQLSGSGLDYADEVQFSAPLVSIKSAIVDVRQETIYSALESDHAHCASFGVTNPRTLATYLQDLAAAVAKAEALSQTIHTPLKLKEHVKVELIGFYDDPDASVESDIRLYFAKYHLSEFLQKGPERCLEERLTRVSRRHGAPGGRDAADGPNSSQRGGGLNILTGVQNFWKSTVGGTQQQRRPDSPDIVVTLPSARPETGEGNSLPPTGGMRPHSLTLPAFSTPGFQRPSSRGSGVTASTMSDPTDLERSPRDDDSETHEGPDAAENRARAASDHTGLDRGSKGRADGLSNTYAMMDSTAGFSRPNADRRKFMWIHVPFTNPLWVKVSREHISLIEDMTMLTERPRTFLTNYRRHTVKTSASCSTTRIGSQSTYRDDMPSLSRHLSSPPSTTFLLIRRHPHDCHTQAPNSTPAHCRRTSMSTSRIFILTHTGTLSNEEAL